MPFYSQFIFHFYYLRCGVQPLRNETKAGRERKDIMAAGLTKQLAQEGQKHKNSEPMLRAYASSFAVPKTSGYSFPMLFQCGFA